MSAQDSPTYYFNGINFNPSFYETNSNGGLSESVANGLYLRKTVPDTATALETFSSGIYLPDSVNATSSTINGGLINQTNTVGSSSSIVSNTFFQLEAYPANVNLGSRSTYYSSDMNITDKTTSHSFLASPNGIQLTDPVNGNLNIDATGITFPLDGAFETNGNINIYTNTLNKSVNIASSRADTTTNISTAASRTAVLHLGDGNSSSAAIHIGNGTTASNNINILNGANSTGTINMGVSTGTTTAIASKTIQIGSVAPIDNTKTITIGGTSGSFDTQTTISGKTTVSKLTATLTSPLTVSYTPTFTSSQIGYSFSWTGATTATTVAATPKSLASLDLPPGVWFLQGFAAGFVAGNYVFLGFNTAVNAFGGWGANNSACLNASASFMFSVSTTTTHYLVVQTQVIANITGIMMTAFRIA